MKMIYPTLLCLLAMAGCGQEQKATLDTTPPQGPPAFVEVATNKPAPPEKPPAPYGIKKIYVGMSQAAFMASKPNIYLTFMSDGVKCYSLKETVAGIKCEPLCSFEDYGDGKVLDRLQFAVRDYDFRAIKEALIEKYGEPTNRRDVTKRNAMGASFHGEELEWINATSRIKIEEVGSKVSESTFFFRYIDPKGRTTKEDQALAKKKKDI